MVALVMLLLMFNSVSAQQPTKSKYQIQNANGKCLSYDANKKLVVDTCTTRNTTQQWTISTSASTPSGNTKLCTSDNRTTMCATHTGANTALSLVESNPKQWSLENIKTPANTVLADYKRLRDIQTKGPPLCFELHSSSSVRVAACTQNGTPPSQQWKKVQV